MTQHSGPCKIAVLGSCVSRDTLEYVQGSTFELVEYIARQSLASAFGNKQEMWSESSLTGLQSSWQRKAALRDLTGSYGSLVEGLAEVDLILLDLVDERGGIAVDPDGCVITKSLEISTSGVLEANPGFKMVRFGTDEHYARWVSGVDRLLAQLIEQGLEAKLVCIENEWATFSVEGLQAPFGKSTLDSGDMNRRYVRYFEYIRDRGVRTIVVPKELCVATESHKWGAAPFHYASGFYRYIVRELASFGVQPTANSSVYPTRVLCRNGGSVSLSGPSEDDHIFRQIDASSDFYEAELLDAISPLLHEGDCIIDVGANIGNHAVYWGALVRARVVAIEPVSDAYGILVRNIEANSLEGSVYPRNFALGASEELASIGASLENNIGATHLLRSQSGGVRVHTLDGLLEREGLVAKAVKIDVEGWELDVLKGGSRVLREDRPMLVVECESEAAFLKVSEYLAVEGYVMREAFNATPTYLFLPKEFSYGANYTNVEHLADIVARASRRSILAQNTLHHLARRVANLDGR